MSSFLVDCPNCKNVIAKNSICPNCNYGGESADGGTVNVASECCDEFARRRAIHNKNFGMSFALKMGAGFFGLLTMICWALFLFRGNVIAFIGVGITTVMSGIFGWVIFNIEQLYPIALHCPQCDSRLDNLNMEYDNCPCCQTKLT